VHVSQRGFVSAEQLLVAFSVNSALPPSQASVHQYTQTRLG
jgi:hypothetical protein